MIKIQKKESKKNTKAAYRKQEEKEGGIQIKECEAPLTA